MRHRIHRCYLPIALVILLSACALPGGQSAGTPSAPAAPAVITWPFHAGTDHWAIVNGYRGFIDHAPGGSPNNYALFAFDFAKCLPDKVQITSAFTGTCDLAGGWANTVGAPVYAPVSGTIAWPDDGCRGLSLNVDGHAGYRVALFHIDPPSGKTWRQLANSHTHYKQGDQIGTVSAGGCIGSGNHIHLVLYSCTSCASDPGSQRVGHPFDGPWSIGHCPYPDDAHKTNEYRGSLVPCAASTAAPTAAPTVAPAQGTTIYTYKGHTNKVRVLAWSPDGRRIATGSDDFTAQVWDAQTGAHAVVYRGHSSYVEGVAWSPDGKRIASGSADGTVQIWDPNTGQHLFTYTQGAWVNRIAWSPDGRYIASGGQTGQPGQPVTVQVWDATNGQRLATYRGHTNGVFAVAWSPDGKYIASDGYDQTLQVWDAHTGKPVTSYHGNAFYFGLSWSPDSRRVAFGGSDNTVDVFDVASQRVVGAYTGHTDYIGDIAWSPNGTYIASGSGDGTVRIINATSGDLVYTYRAQSGHLDAVAWSPDGHLIASGSDNSTIAVWAAV